MKKKYTSLKNYNLRSVHTSTVVPLLIKEHILYKDFTSCSSIFYKEIHCLEEKTEQKLDNKSEKKISFPYHSYIYIT